jgi:hypothetical protein
VTLPYENATSGKGAVDDMQKLLRGFGASSFGVMEEFDKGEVVVQFLWPCEPALLGVDDGVPNRMDRVKALGNTLIPQIPELLGRAILAAST